MVVMMVVVVGTAVVVVLVVRCLKRGWLLVAHELSPTAAQHECS